MVPFSSVTGWIEIPLRSLEYRMLDLSGGTAIELIQGGSKSVSPLARGDSFSNPLSKHTMPITVTLPLTSFLGSNPIQS